MCTFRYENPNTRLCLHPAFSGSRQTRRSHSEKALPACLEQSCVNDSRARWGADPLPPWPPAPLARDLQRLLPPQPAGLVLLKPLSARRPGELARSWTSSPLRFNSFHPGTHSSTLVQPQRRSPVVPKKLLWFFWQLWLHVIADRDISAGSDCLKTPATNTQRWFYCVFWVSLKYKPFWKLPRHSQPCKWNISDSKSSGEKKPVTLSEEEHIQSKTC